MSRNLAIVLAAYMGVVALFESAIGFFQPTTASTLVITTFDESGAPHDRVLTRLESDGRLYVAANHWPRAWYRRALENPQVKVALEGEKEPYHAVPVDGAESERVDREHSLGPVFRFLTGFPPRTFLRLEPAGTEPA